MASQTGHVIIKFGLVDEVTDDLSIRKPPRARACLLAQDSKLLLIIIVLKVKVSALIQFPLVMRVMVKFFNLKYVSCYGRCGGNVSLYDLRSVEVTICVDNRARSFCSGELSLVLDRVNLSGSPL